MSYPDREGESNFLRDITDRFFECGYDTSDVNNPVPKAGTQAAICRFMAVNFTYVLIGTGLAVGAGITYLALKSKGKRRKRR